MASDTALSMADLADNSDIASYNWNDRGVAPRGYVGGMAVSFGRVYCKMNADAMQRPKPPPRILGMGLKRSPGDQQQTCRTEAGS